MKLFFSIALFFFGIHAYSQSSNPFNIPGRSNKVIQDSLSEDYRGEQTAVDTKDFSGLINTTIRDTMTTVSGQNPFDRRMQASGLAQESKASRSEQPVEKIMHAVDGSQKDMKVMVLVYSLVMLIILTLAISMDKERFKAMMKSSINSNYLRTLYRDSKAWSNGQGIIFYVFFILNAAFISWQLMIKFNGPWSYNLFVIIGALVACYLIRHLILLGISVIFSLGSEVDLHNFSVGLHNMVLGILLLPLIMAIEFLPGVSYNSFLWVVLAIFALIYVLRQVKGLLSCMGMRGFNPFYFFVYLCAIEIAPVLVVYKMMIGAL